MDAPASLEKESGGCTPIIVASLYAKIDIVEFLPEKEAEISSRSHSPRSMFKGRSNVGKYFLII